MKGVAFSPFRSLVLSRSVGLREGWRRFNTAAASVALSKKEGPDFRLVPFKREDILKVITEVPEVKYYRFPFEPRDNPYLSVPMDQPISLESLGDPELDYERAELVTENTTRLRMLDPHATDTEITAPLPQEDFMKVSAPPPFSHDRALKFSKLENGLRIASLDRGEATTSLGLFVHAGSRYEDSSNYGVTAMIEAAAFHSTAHLSWLRTVKTIETIGATAGCSGGREHLAYQAECLRMYVPILVPLLIGNVLFPRLLPWELKSQVAKLEEARKKLETTPDMLITEQLHATAWSKNTLGNKSVVTEVNMEHHHPDTLRNFMLQHFSPDRMVFAGVNVDHDELCKWVMRSYVDYNSIPSTPRNTATPQYTGGDTRIEASGPTLHLAIGYETPGGWNSPDLVPLTVLQTLLGGGGSFSTGGPGKGLYTRLYTEVLSSEWVETCVAFNSQYSDSGLFGLYMTAAAPQAVGMVNLMGRQLAKMGDVSTEELERSKNALKSSIWMNLESRSVILEDVARQLIMSGTVYSGADFCSLVDAVTSADIKRVVSRMVQQPPTVVAYGDIHALPGKEALARELQRLVVKS